MRAGAGLAILLLAACSQSAPQPDPGSLIECALSGAQSFTLDCAVERGQDAGAPILIVHHPDGGFRRFAKSGDGSGFVTADGSQLATVRPGDGGVEISVGLDRYRLPVAVFADEDK